MRSPAFSASGFEIATENTRKRIFLEEMNAVVRRAALIGVIRSYCSVGSSDCLPLPDEAMLRVYFPQLRNNYTDPAMEKALHDTPVYCWFFGSDSGAFWLPDESTVMRFRHYLEEFGVSKIILAEFDATLQFRGLSLRSRAAINTTLIAATNSTKNEGGALFSEKLHRRKANQHHIGTRAQFGVDAESGLVYTPRIAEASTPDAIQSQSLPQGQETDVFADSGCRGVEKLEETKDLKLNWHIAMMPGKRLALHLETVSGNLKTQSKKSKMGSRQRLNIRHESSIVGLDSQRFDTVVWSRTRAITDVVCAEPDKEAICGNA